MIPALALGLFVGIVLGVVGGGGSIIAVPALVYGVGMSPAEAIPTSLLVVGVSSLAALIPRLREGLNWPVVLHWSGPPGIPAAWAGAAVGRLLDPNILMLAFAVIMVAAGIRMLMRTTRNGRFLQHRSEPCLPLLRPQGRGGGRARRVPHRTAGCRRAAS